MNPQAEHRTGKGVIAHVNFAREFRGGERQTLLLIEALARMGQEQVLIVRKGAQLADKVPAIPDLKVIEMDKPFIAHLNKLRKVALIHAHETKAAQFAWFGFRFFGLPYLITRRVDNPVKQNFFNRSMYRNAFRVAPVSGAIERELSKLEAFSNIEIVPDAYTGLRHDPDSVKHLRERFEGKFVIANIGELDNAHKGQYYLIEAMKQLAQTYPDIHLLFLGRGKDEQVYRTQAAGLNNISFEGFVDNVGDYLQIMDLFVFPSLHEGLGSILLDVMKAGIAIIASDVGGIPEIVRHEGNGVLVEPANAQQIFAAIERLYLDEQTRNNLAANALQDIESYSPDAMAERYLALYQTVL